MVVHVELRDVLKDSDREAFITALLKEELDLDVESIESLGSHNTFVHLVILKASHTGTSPRPRQPGTVPLPTPIPKKLIIRIPNPATQNDAKVKIINEVAALTLVRTAPGSVKIPVADVYAWSGEGWGWMVMSLLEGTTLQKIWTDLSLDQKAAFGSNFAPLLAQLQSVPVPSAKYSFGGFAFDANGDVIIGQHPLGYGGPYTDVSDFQLGMIKTQLVLADANPAIQGWHEHGLRDRIDKFVASAEGLRKICATIPQKPTFIHFDLMVGNILVDASTLAITGIVDFELSHAGPVSDEYVNGLAEVGHLHCENDSDEGIHSPALVAPGGFPDGVPLEGDIHGGDGPCDWATARAVDKAFAEAGVQRPRTIGGFEEASRIYWFAQEICQWYFEREGWRKRVDIEAEKLKCRTKMEKDLTHWGF